MSNSTTFTPAAFCVYPQAKHVVARLWLVTIFGSFVALLGSILNMHLFRALVTRSRHRRSHCLHLIYLAMCDTFISVSYIMLMSVNVLVDYTQSVRLMAMWFSYMIPMITISHVAMTTSSYLILGATIDRYLAAAQSPFYEKFQRHRTCIILASITLGFIVKGGIWTELEVRVIDACRGTLVERMLVASPLVNSSWFYKTVWRFWLRNCISTFVPFVLLAIYNVKIVLALRRPNVHRLMSGAHRNMRSIRAATRMLVLVVVTYLLTNALNVIITVWEFVDKRSLYLHHVDFYSFGTDAVSLLTVISSAARLPIYCACSEHIRASVLAALPCHTDEMAAAANDAPSSSTRRESSETIVGEFAVELMRAASRKRREMAPRRRQDGDKAPRCTVIVCNQYSV